MQGYANKKNSPMCTVKIDLRKAYDRIDWDFLRTVLNGLQLHPKFVYSVMQCVTSPRFSIAINGSSHGFFESKRGIRQGDPKSPTLFIFCMEYLSRLLAARTTDNDFNYHAKCAKQKITHLAFVDDLMLFGRGNAMSMAILADTMPEFSACSGLEINKAKSNLFTCGIERMDFEEIKEGVECYWLQVFPLLANVRDRIVSICRQFLWGTKHFPIAWMDLCPPKDECGLGFRDLGAWNKALLARMLWNIHLKKGSLWIKWVHSYFLQHKTIWEWTAKKRNSPLFKRVLEIRDEMLSVRTTGKVAQRWAKWDETKGTTEAYEGFLPKGERKL
ncbi:uncharacterized protein LOC121752840 [Salvia splendens]|uniref:uncharacterized protein LOC121752840 n=1 Tax=Salvia splendens TaxID=180675 RepID=UPI001C255587|nr:uncharacterized protein LOC121752840 [Salvia splendens]